MRKPALSLLLVIAIALVITLAGCSDSKQPTSQTNSNKSDRPPAPNPTSAPPTKPGSGPLALEEWVGTTTSENGSFSYHASIASLNALRLHLEIKLKFNATHDGTWLAVIYPCSNSTKCDKKGIGENVAYHKGPQAQTIKLDLTTRCLALITQADSSSLNSTPMASDIHCLPR